MMDDIKDIIISHIPNPPVDPGNRFDGPTFYHPDWGEVEHEVALYLEASERFGEKHPDEALHRAGLWAAFIVAALKDSPWYENAHEELCRDWDERAQLQRDPAKWYGVPRYN